MSHVITMWPWSSGEDLTRCACAVQSLGKLGAHGEEWTSPLQVRMFMFQML